jgi:hypothetical protein
MILFRTNMLCSYSIKKVKKGNLHKVFLVSITFIVSLEPIGIPAATDIETTTKLTPYR